MEGEQMTNLSDNPLLAQLVFVKMEEVMDKLKLLDYEEGFCAALKFKPFPRWSVRLLSFSLAPRDTFFF